MVRQGLGGLVFSSGWLLVAVAGAELFGIVGGGRLLVGPVYDIIYQKGLVKNVSL